MPLQSLRGGCLLFVAMLVGCGSGETLPTVPVTGTITMAGQPVADATVTFVAKSEGGRAASGTTDSAGKYTLKTYLSPTSSPTGALPGDYAVTVTKAEKAATMSPDDMAKKMGGKGPVMAPPKSLIPERYTGAQSGLAATVKTGGPNDFPFDLEAK